jgi:hypothetical protein
MLQDFGDTSGGERIDGLFRGDGLTPAIVAERYDLVGDVLEGGRIR